MKINPNISPVTANELANRTKGAPGALKQAAGGSERVDLSALSAQLQDAEAASAGVPIVNSAHVAEIKQAISEGRFQINPERIADGLIESVQQLLARQSS